MKSKIAKNERGAAPQKNVNVGLIGCGARLRSVLKEIAGHDPGNRIHFVSAYDPDPDSIGAVREQFGPGCRNSPSEKTLLADPDIEWVFIGSWNCHHARQAVLALGAGKNVFCEKPLATTLEDCLAIRDAVHKSGKTFAFGLVLRYSPHYQRIMEVVRSGAIGRIVSFEFNETLPFNHGGYIFGNWRRKRENAGTHLLEKCCHDIDLANWIIGSLPVRVASFGGRDFFTPGNARLMEQIGLDENGRSAYCSWPDPHRCNPFDDKADIFDNQVAILQYANGVRGTFHTNCNAGTPERRFYLCGTEGTLRADLCASTIEVQKIGWASKIEKTDTHVEDGHGGGDQQMGEAMVETMLCGVPPLASCEDGIKSAIVAFGLDLAADEGRVVDLVAMWRRAGISLQTGKA
ncbi:MAG: Gfo/Idh/MocA family oxidoreductase [Terrimicrobiaceae bacterium]